MRCPARDHRFIDCVDGHVRLHARRTPLSRAASRPILDLFVPRLPRDFYFIIPVLHAGNAARLVVPSSLPRSFP